MLTVELCVLIRLANVLASVCCYSKRNFVRSFELLLISDVNIKCSLFTDSWKAISI